MKNKLLLISYSRFMYWKPNVKNEFVSRFPDKVHMMMRLKLAAKWSFSAEQSHCLICGVAGDICAQRTSIYTGEDSLLMSKFVGVPALSSANFFSVSCNVLEILVKNRLGHAQWQIHWSEEPQTCTYEPHDFHGISSQNVGLVPCGIWNFRIRHCYLCLDHPCIRNLGTINT